MGYNGWTNKETWLVNNWFHPERKEDVHFIQEIIESDIEDCPKYLKDFINVHMINWAELESKFDEKEKQND